MFNTTFNLIGTRHKVAAGNPHTIISITDDGNGNRLVSLAGPHGLSGDEFLLISGTPSDGVYQGGEAAWQVVSPTTFILLGGYTADSTGGTWAAVTQYSNGYTGDDVVSTELWAGTAVLEATGKGGDGDATTGGGGGGYAKATRTVPFPDVFNINISSGRAAVDDGIDTVILAQKGDNGADGGGGGFSSTGDQTNNGGNGGTNVGAGGGAATAVGGGQNGEDGDGGTSSANGGPAGSGDQSGGDYIGLTDGGPQSSGGSEPGGGGSAGGAVPGGTGGGGQVVITHYELV